MTDNSLEKAQLKFYSLAEEYWDNISKANSKAANANVRAGDRLVENWMKRGLIFELLSPFLDHASAQVRFTSAAYLINHEPNTRAISILRDLIENQNNLISTSAAAVLRLGKISSE